MIWLNSISELQYYNQPKGVPCYCELLINPLDMLLQGSFQPNVTPYTINLYVYSADGLTQYEDATAFFSYYFAVNPSTSEHFFNARLNQWSDAMCDYKCFIIRAVVVSSSGVTVFDKYTERYCQSDCCDTASDIVFMQDAQDVATDTPPFVVSTSSFLTDCGHALIKIVSKDNCYNKFSERFLGTPTTILSGTASFDYVQSTVIRGRIVRRPRDISRELSYNCVLQRVESTPVFLLEGYEYFPAWKMFEIEGQLHSQYIWVQDRFGINDYQFDGGQAFRKVNGANGCTELFKLETELQECRQRQVFGCSEPCETTGYSGYDAFFIVPDNFTANFYDDSGTLVGETLQDLIDYLRTRDGMTDVAEISFSPASPTSPASCEYTAVIGFSGTGYLPTSIYYNSPININRVFSVNFEEASEICDFVSNQCVLPTLTFEASEPDCVEPTLTFEATEVMPTDLTITGYGDWVIQAAGTEAGLLNNQVRFSIHVINSTIVPVEEGDTEFEGEIIGIMEGAGRPQVIAVINSSNNSVADDQYITIDEYGLIRYSGEPTTYNIGESVEIQFSNLVYNVL